ncbi:MAG TPA: SDR family NAD(P)-dependent oxidoreductase [Nevskiaceae bacterium]|nr:SDR family NAD(P)-dependent oxidoreductase [Nevskiaceae bacterium]
MTTKVIVITGASSGIGEAAALQLARRGTHLCLIARRRDELDRVRKRVEARGGAASVYPLDLNDPAGIDACCAAIVKDHQRVDVLINNAGRSIRRTIKESLDRDHDFERVMQLNYFAPVRMTLRLLPQFLKQRRGHIINVSSVLGFLPAPRFAAYASSKAALDAFSRSIAAELEDDNVRVTVLNYPLVKTAMTAPTAVYGKMKQMDVRDAAGWIVDAVRNRPARRTTRFAHAAGVATAIAPGPVSKVLTEVMKRRIRRLQGKVDSTG